MHGKIQNQSLDSPNQRQNNLNQNTLHTRTSRVTSHVASEIQSCPSNMERFSNFCKGLDRFTEGNIEGHRGTTIFFIEGSSLKRPYVQRT